MADEEIDDVDDIVMEMDDTLAFARILAQCFGWNDESVQYLDEFLFPDVFNAELDNRIYIFTVTANQTKTFRFHALDGPEGFLHRRFQAEVDMDNEYFVVCNHGDEWQFTGVDEQDMETTVFVIATDQPHQGVQPIFNHMIPVLLPYHEYGFSLLCKPGCVYVCTLIRLGDENDEAQINNHLQLQNIPENIPATVTLQERELIMQPQINYVFRTQGNAIYVGYLAFATLRLMPASLVELEAEE